MNPDLTVAVLAGGSSSRMGSDKSFALLQGRPLIEHVLERVAPLAVPVILITNQPQQYAHLQLPMFPDVIPQKGSLGGIYTALHASTTHAVLCVACDMPFLNPALLSHLVAISEHHAATVPVAQGRRQTLHAVYRKACLPSMLGAIDQNNLKISECLRHVSVNWVEESALRRFDPELQSFVNVNRPSDLQQAEERLKGSTSKPNSSE